MKSISGEDAAEKVLERVLAKVIPNKKKREETLNFAKNLADDLTEKLLKSGIEAEVKLQGSIAKDTWLSGETDIDMFICVPKYETKEIFKRVLDVAKSLVGKGWVEAYAEHPYIEATVTGFKVDFVPCFKVNSAEEAGSSVDRTPLHTAYITNRIDERKKGEVRLLKRFLHGIGVYGAEIKVKGFSGYLCELLTLYYGSFKKTLEGTSSWRFGQVIDIENLCEGKIGELRSRFNAPLIVIDPVDANRNVAAAVSKERFSELIMAAKLFLNKPTYALFFPRETIPLSEYNLRNRMDRPGVGLIFAVFKCGEACPDVLWGELYKTIQALGRLLSENDFHVLRDIAWSDDMEWCVLVFGLESTVIPFLRRHMGPPADSVEATNFVEEYTRGKKRSVVVSGPWVDDDRWVVVVKRQCVDAASLLKRSLRNRIEEIGVASELTENLRLAKVYVNAEIVDFYSTNREFARFLTDFLRGKPKWMA